MFSSIIGSIAAGALFIFATSILSILFVSGGWSLFCNTVLSVNSNFAIISLRKRELVALLKLCSCCCVTVSVLFLFLAEPRIGLWFVVSGL